METLENVIERYSGYSMKLQVAHIYASNPPEYAGGYASGYKTACTLLADYIKSNCLGGDLGGIANLYKHFSGLNFVKHIVAYIGGINCANDICFVLGFEKACGLIMGELGAILKARTENEPEANNGIETAASPPKHQNSDNVAENNAKYTVMDCWRMGVEIEMPECLIAGDNITIMCHDMLCNPCLDYAKQGYVVEELFNRKDTKGHFVGIRIVGVQSFGQPNQENAMAYEKMPDVEKDISEEGNTETQTKAEPQRIKGGHYWDSGEWVQPPVRIRHGEAVEVLCDGYPPMIGRYIGKGMGVVELYNYHSGTEWVIGKVQTRALIKKLVSDEKLLDFIQD